VPVVNSPWLEPLKLLDYKKLCFITAVFRLSNCPFIVPFWQANNVLVMPRAYCVYFTWYSTIYAIGDTIFYSLSVERMILARSASLWVGSSGFP